MTLADAATALAGGLMIGGAAALLLLANGRIMGASGIVGGLIDGSRPMGAVQPLAFLAGLIAVPALLVAAGIGGAAPAAVGPVGLVVAGLLVGFGSRLGNGCTSGHGVCGVSRLSRRSMAATATFMATAVLGVLVARALGWEV